jgi:hypothetical protein
MDDLRDLPEHTRRASLRACARRAAQLKARAVLEAEQTQPIGPVTPSLANDPDRRSLFLADVSMRVMAKGATHTANYLQRMFHFRRKVAWEIVKEARREMAAAMATQTDELRAVAEARLESLMRKADKACDLTNYGRALKEWMRLHGLYRQDDTTLGDFAALMRTVTAEADAHKIVDAEFTVTGEEDEKPAERVDWQEPAGFIPAKTDEDEDDES